MYSVVEVLDLFSALEDLTALTEADLDASESTLAFSDYQLFLAEVSSHYDTYAKSSIEAFDAGLVTFSQLTVVLSFKGTVVTMLDRGAHVCGILNGAKVVSGFSGTYLKVSLKVHTHTGKGISESEVSIQVGAFSGQKNLD